MLDNAFISGFLPIPLWVKHFISNYHISIVALEKEGKQIRFSMFAT